MPSVELPPLAAPQVLVVPGRRGVWSVRATDDASAVSVHATATEAGRAAHRYALTRGATLVIVHDRYARVQISPTGR